MRYLREMDFMRATAAIAVIVIHVTSSQSSTNKLAFIVNILMCFAVPVFIIISGYLLQFSDLGRTEFNFPSFLKKRLNKVIIPYLIWSLIYILYTNYQNNVDLSAKEFILRFTESLVLGRGAEHLYFMVIIIQLYLVYPMFRVLLIKNEKLALLLSFVVSFYFIMEPYFRERGMILLPVFGQKYYFVLFFRWSFYFVLGMYVARHRENIIKVIEKTKVELLVLWSIIGTILILVIKSLGVNNPLRFPIIILYSIGCFFFILSICHYLSESRGVRADWYVWFSRQSFIIYLSHLLLIRVILYKGLMNIFGKDIWKYNMGMIKLFLATVVLSVGFTYIISLLPVAQWFGGARRVVKKVRAEGV